MLMALLHDSIVRYFLKTEARYITLDSMPGIDSGRAVSWPQRRLNDSETGRGFPEGVDRAVIVFSIGEADFWEFYVDLLSMA